VQQEQIRTLTEKKYELQAEEEKSKMSPEEQRESLLAKMKRDNMEVESITQQAGLLCQGFRGKD
jgi:predicted Rossmann fold nucleotide-binding protein DprA/Smf involved in DNA uptake